MPKQITFGRPNGRYIPFIVIVATPRLRNDLYCVEWDVKP